LLSKDLSSLPKWGGGEEVVEDWNLLGWGQGKKKKLSRIHLYHVVVAGIECQSVNWRLQNGR